MPTKKIGSFPKHLTCRHPGHSPPSMRLFEPGMYEHTCPACGHVTSFVVQPNSLERPTCDQQPWPSPPRPSLVASRS